MEHNQANIDALSCCHEEADSRIVAHVSQVMELCSTGGALIWKIFKLTLMP